MKNEEEDGDYFSENNIKNDPDWNAEEGSSGSFQVPKEIDGSETNNSINNFKSQKLKGKRLRKKLLPEENSLRKHKKDVDAMQNMELEDRDYTCKICGIVCDNKTDHTSHLEGQHGVGNANTCPLCLVVLDDRAKR